MDKKIIFWEILGALIGSVLVGFIFLTIAATLGGNSDIGYEVPGVYGLYFGLSIGGILGSYLIRRAKSQSSQKISTAILIGLLVAAIITGYFIQGEIEIKQDALRYNDGANAIESLYPEMKYLKESPEVCLNGCYYKYDKYGEDYYFAYIVYGSELIAKATCFKFDENSVVSKVGEFPDPSDSFVGYTDIDPLTCKGNK